jgi:hypothetical protein
MGVILIVLVAFVLGTAVAAFAFTTFDRESGVAPGVAFEYDYEEDRDDDGARDLLITVASESGSADEGNGFEGGNVYFVCRDGSCGGIDEQSFDDHVGGGSGPDGRFVAGDGLALRTATSPPEVGRDADLYIRWEEPAGNGKTTIVGVWRGPDA